MRRDAPGIEYLETASFQLFGTGIGRANDDPRFSHADVLRCFDVAIALAGAEGERRDAAHSARPLNATIARGGSVTLID
jgi:hypothetical protein